MSKREKKNQGRKEREREKDNTISAIPEPKCCQPGYSGRERYILLVCAREREREREIFKKRR